MKNKLQKNIRIIRYYVEKFKTPISSFLIIAIFYYLGVSIYANWTNINAFEWNFQYSYLLGAFTILMIRHFIMAHIWQKMLNNLSVEIDFWQSFRIWYLALGGRYLPGRIWYAAGMLYFSSEIGISKKKVLLGGTFNFSISLISAFFASIVVLPSYLSWEMTLPVKIICIISVLPLFYLLFAMASKAICFISKKRGYQKNELTIAGFSHWIYPSILYVISWLLYGLSLYMLLLSVTSVPVNHIPSIVSSYAISHVAGVLSFVTPAGLAVREGVLTVLLSKLLPSYVASAMAILCRLLFTLAELTSFLMALVVNKRLKPDVQSGFPLNTAMAESSATIKEP